MSRIAAPLYRAALNLAGDSRRRPLSVLIYHRVLAAPDFMRPGEPTTAQFAWQMQLLRRYFNVLPLVEAAQALRNGTLPPRAVAITFDDGYADNATLALPILRRLGLPATVFVATAYLNGGRMWNDTIIETFRTVASDKLDLSAEGLPVLRLDDEASRCRAAELVIRHAKYLGSAERERLATTLAKHARRLPDDLMMTSEQLRSLRVGGVEVGGHTHSHPILSGLDTAASAAEIAGGKARLESMVDGPVQAFAYPNGRPGQDYDDEHVAQVRAAGFSTAVSTRVGVAAGATDTFQLPRYTPWDQTVPRYLLRMALMRRRLVTC
ncbi:polysaccharide deacetylase family protein [Parahaliea mediterranea]|uniref:polysaccharide deacetylase family protein n=1 Tax=Parahaliea mediterranea TaxID=651086 RepID=UPI000E2E4317|nr:polysaccharide deacetylase family protein [Parahaliea mediterranea]